MRITSTYHEGSRCLRMTFPEDAPFPAMLVFGPLFEIVVLEPSRIRPNPD